MSSAIDILDKFNTWLFDKCQEVGGLENVDVEVDFHSNVLPETEHQKLRIYVNRRIIRETQDTLAVDVEDFGKKRYTSNGVYSMSFFMPRNVPLGYGAMERVAHSIRNALRKERFSCLWVRHVTATPYNMENNCYRYELTFSIDFDEIL